jgi:hypothetical protein
LLRDTVEEQEARFSHASPKGDAGEVARRAQHVVTEAALRRRSSSVPAAAWKA